jgi:hypothetical protein
MKFLQSCVRVRARRFRAARHHQLCRFGIDDGHGHFSENHLPGTGIELPWTRMVALRKVSRGNFLRRGGVSHPYMRCLKFLGIICIGIIFLSARGGPVPATPGTASIRRGLSDTEQGKSRWVACSNTWRAYSYQR